MHVSVACLIVARLAFVSNSRGRSMRKHIRGWRLLALAAVVVGVAAVPSALAVSSITAADSSSSNGLWFVQLNGAAAANGGSASANKAEKAAFNAEAKKAGVS